MILNTFKLNKQLDATKKQLNDAINAQKLAEKDLSEAQDTIGDFMTEKKNLMAKISLLEHKSKVTKEVINKRVNTELANIGINSNTVSENPPVAALSPENAFSEYEKLTGNEKSTFYAKNEKLILIALSRQHNAKNCTVGEPVKNMIKI